MAGGGARGIDSIVSMPCEMIAAHPMLGLGMGPRT